MSKIAKTLDTVYIYIYIYIVNFNFIKNFNKHKIRLFTYMPFCDFQKGV